MTFEEDREYLEQQIGKLDASGRVEHLLRTSFERQFFELSLHNRRINEQYIKRRFDPTKWSMREAFNQLDDFLSTHEPYRDLSAVDELQNRLRQKNNSDTGCI